MADAYAAELRTEFEKARADYLESTAWKREALLERNQTLKVNTNAAFVNESVNGVSTNESLNNIEPISSNIESASSTSTTTHFGLFGDLKASKRNLAERSADTNAPTKKVKVTDRHRRKMASQRFDIRGYDFYDTSFYEKSFSHEKSDRSVKVDLTALGDLARTYKDTRTNQSLVSLRQALKKLPFRHGVNHRLVKEARILDENRGLRIIIDNRHDFPFDVYGDAMTIWYRWKVGDIDPSLLRGISTRQGKVQSRSIVPAYEHKISSDYRGSGNLQNGQWWPLKLCLVRDGAHGSVQGGIYGGDSNQGAQSIVISGGGPTQYEDEDLGDTIKYTGTEAAEEAGDGNRTRNTKLMAYCVHNNNDVRVFRHERLGSIYAPTKGIRYDGLYKVTAQEQLDVKKNHWRFTLQRLPGQDPIRYIGLGTDLARPSPEEIAAYEAVGGN